MRGRTPVDLSGRCPRCWMLEERCFCALIPEVVTRTEILVLRHYKESWRTTNTARIAALAMPRCRIVGYGEQGGDLDVAALVEPGTWLLYPDGGAVPADPPRRLLVLDGSWAQARRMFKRVPGLAGLPRLSVTPPPTPVARLRRPHLVEGMATLEAIAAAMERIEGAEVAAPLRALFDDFVRLYRVPNRDPADYLSPSGM